jgi:hypothetical protein
MAPRAERIRHSEENDCEDVQDWDRASSEQVPLRPYSPCHFGIAAALAEELSKTLASVRSAIWMKVSAWLMVRALLKSAGP